jgi:hypothetical protein
MRALAFLVIVLSMFLGETTAQILDKSELEAADQLARITRVAIADVREKLRPTLTQNERAILDQIDFRVDPTVTFQGGAFLIGDRQRAVVISSGVAYLMNVLGQSTAVGYRGNVECMQMHMLASIKEAFRGMDPRTPSGSRRRIWNMSAYAKVEPACKDADQLIVGDAEMEQAIGATTKVGVTLVILHEIAHQLLHHVESPVSNPPTAADLDRSRKNEDEADRWAIRKALEIREPLILATPYLFIMTATGLNDITIEGELSSTHPLGARRALVILDEIEREAREMNAPQEMLDGARGLRRELQKLLPN